MKGKRKQKTIQIWLMLFGIAALVMVGSCASSQSVKDESHGEGMSSTSSKKITNIFTEEDSEGIHVIIEGSQQLTYTSVKQNFPLGILFYFPETALENELGVRPESELIDAIEATQLAEAEAGSRILISLNSDMPYDVTPEGLGIKISFSKPVGTSMSSDPFWRQPMQPNLKNCRKIPQYQGFLQFRPLPWNQYTSPNMKIRSK